ncbi:vacuolar protein sorting-associated protein 8 homolog [Pollicipes pollicipes]|uniref:vacuolar protein sorting-associated protein 8 homolog n=1 Tax=Pollicipes pollicipes TaxID=41117 RepID=UPI0018859A34|nr:vacuolar protein sorting-associated protein 8 homolog [Pollicipes pollicipes]
MLVAMATMSKVIVVSVRPQLRVLFTHPLEAGPLHVPLLDWQFVVIRVSSGVNMVDPVLTFARKSTVYFYQVCCPAERVKFVPLQWVEFPFFVQNLHWISARTLALIDGQEKLHLWDVRGQQQLETLDLSFVKMVYSTSYFKGLATGGNVSKAMAVAGEKACFESCAVSSGQLLLLGTRGVHVVTLRTWLERLESHVRAGEFAAALRLAWGMYTEQSPAATGARAASGRRQAIIKERMLSLVDEWLLFCLAADQRDQSLTQALPTCVQYLLDLDESAVLFGRIVGLLEPEPAAYQLLLEALLPHIVSGRLTAPPPLLMQQLVTHLEHQDQLQALEECLVRVELGSLDIHQVLPLCWRRGLYDAIIRIHTAGMGDYLSPLLELLDRLSQLLTDGAPLMDGQAQLGNKLLVYISSCLAGRGYPAGQIPAERVHDVKLAVLSALTAVHSKNAADAEPPYPHLRTLLTFDTREFLNVLSLSFEEDVFTSELGMRQRQRIVDILLTLMVDREEYSPSQLGSLFTFIARQMALPNSTVSVSRDLFDKVVDHLTVPGDTAHHEERQQALCELISTGVLEHYDTERLAQLAEKAKFYAICQLLYERRGEHDRTAGCMLRHAAGRGALHRFLADRAAADASVALSLLTELVEIGVAATATLFTTCLSRHLEAAVQTLAPWPQQQYRFLGAVLQQSSSVVLPASVHRRHLDLMCQLDQDQVVQFLSSQDMLDVEQYLQICQKAGNKEGEAYLLDLKGDTVAALGALVDGLDGLGQYWIYTISSS